MLKFMANARLFTVLALVGLLSGGSALAGEAASSNGVKREGPLAALPSSPGSTIDKIKALGDNEWVNLGSPAGDPKWGRALGCSWGGRAFALAPDVRGAYFTGEGKHGHTKRNGFGHDDFWFYDINAHRWICLYPGTDTKNFPRMVKEKELTVNDIGLVINKKGELIPGHLLIHAWGFVTYDTDRRKFVVGVGGAGFGTYFMPGGKAVKESCKVLQAQMKEAKKKPAGYTPWFYDTGRGRFEKESIGARWPGLGKYANFLYISSRKQVLALGGRGGAWYDPDKKTWESVKMQGAARPKGIDFSACYDSKRDRVYMSAGIYRPKPGKDEGHVYIFDVKTGTWSSPPNKENAVALPASNSGMVHYDSVNDRVVVFNRKRKGADSGLSVYSPETGAWSKKHQVPAIMIRRHTCWHGFYDPELNAHFVFLAGDSVDNGVMMAYRYKRAPKKM